MAPDPNPHETPDEPKLGFPVAWPKQPHGVRAATRYGPGAKVVGLRGRRGALNTSDPLMLPRPYHLHSKRSFSLPHTYPESTIITPSSQQPHCSAAHTGSIVRHWQFSLTTPAFPQSPSAHDGRRVGRPQSLGAMQLSRQRMWRRCNRVTITYMVASSWCVYSADL